MQIESFKVFRDLVETSSFSRAAEINGITQSAVSQQIRGIEKKLGVRLIERGKRSFALTAEGQAFLGASRTILAAYDDLANRIQTIQRVVGGEIRLATVLSIGLHELPPFLREFRRKHAQIDVKVDYCRSNEVYTAVMDGDADVGLVAYPTRKTGLQTRSCWQDKLVLITSPDHPFASRRKIQLSELGGCKFVAFEPDLPTRKEIDRRLRDRGVRIKPILEFDNIETVKRAVEIEQAVSIVPETTVGDEVRSGRLVAIELADSGMWRTIGCVLRRSAPESPALKQFLAMLEKIDPASTNRATAKVPS